MFRSVIATAAEWTRSLPGDDLIDDPVGALTHAITIEALPADVWNWIAQMGAGVRAGWYSYDLLDNARQASETRIVSELQRLEVGMIFPALPGATDGFVLVRFEPARFLVLGWLAPHGSWLVSWTFVLESLAERSTRLIVRARAGREYCWHGVPRWATRALAPLVHFIMQRKQLLGIAVRAERTAAARLADVDRPSPYAARRTKNESMNPVARGSAESRRIGGHQHEPNRPA